MIICSCRSDNLQSKPPSDRCKRPNAGPEAAEAFCSGIYHCLCLCIRYECLNPQRSSDAFSSFPGLWVNALFALKLLWHESSFKGTPSPLPLDPEAVPEQTSLSQSSSPVSSSSYLPPILSVAVGYFIKLLLLGCQKPKLETQSLVTNTTNTICCKSRKIG